MSDICRALYELKSDIHKLVIHNTNPHVRVVDLTNGEMTEQDLVFRMNKNIEYLCAAYESNQLKELPFITMFERVLDDNGEQRTTLKDSKYNGRYGVVYFDKKKYSALPLFDLCGDKHYNTDAAMNRVSEIKEDIDNVHRDKNESDAIYIQRCLDAGKLPKLELLSDRGLYKET